MTNERAAASTTDSPPPPGPAGVDPVRLTRTGQPQAVGGADVVVDDDIVDEWGRQSFPASDPPANW